MHLNNVIMLFWINTIIEDIYLNIISVRREGGEKGGVGFWLLTAIYFCQLI